MAGSAMWMPLISGPVVPVLTPLVATEADEEVLLSFLDRDPCACAPEVRDSVEVEAADDEEESTPPACTCSLVE